MATSPSSNGVPIVLVTGASGFIGSSLVKRLLEDGQYRVRGTVRNASDEAKTQPLRQLVPDAKYPLELVTADLGKDEGWKEALEGCTYVFHVATPSPYFYSGREGLVDIPREGAKRIFKAIEEAGCVKRVVVTSTMVSCMDMNKQGTVLTEEDWTPDVLDPKYGFYAIGKAQAEREAWKSYERMPEDKRFELVTILPGLVIGPNALQNAISTNIFLKQLLEGGMPMLPHFTLPMVDLRDVLDLHVLALTHEKAPGNRYLLSAENIKLKTMAGYLREEFTPHGYSVTSRNMPNWLARLIARFDADMQFSVVHFLKFKKIFAADKVKEHLGFTYRPVRGAIIDGAHTMIELGSIVRNPGYKGHTASS